MTSYYLVNQVWTERWCSPAGHLCLQQKEQHGRHTKSQCLLPGFFFFFQIGSPHIIQVPGFSSLSSTKSNVTFSSLHCKRRHFPIGVIVNILWKTSATSEKQPKVSRVGNPPITLVVVEFPFSGVQTDAAFLHWVFLTYDADAFHLTDKVPGRMMLQGRESRRWPLFWGGPNPVRGTTEQNRKSCCQIQFRAFWSLFSGLLVIRTDWRLTHGSYFSFWWMKYAMLHNTTTQFVKHH